ncbi:hypothetical protein L210DRAFT_3621282 [Boletus edulis BED1]|uniref:Probable RNA polymerase II nuclear localization protein SLC7A6OS n=1 Tax=Boletus edulis BED1 TaxID=1328754 RepID=A0AAD4GEW2_BOLED|nr:hypothetical protein L210DRAFT_3621282 [Boletus edulis BED1]
MDVLRIKRKRTEEPLDALGMHLATHAIMPPLRKKTRGGVDVFQFAQTVENGAWQDGALRQNLQSQLSKLAQDLNKNAKVQSPPGRETRLAPRTDNVARRYAVKVTGDAEVPRRKRRPTSPPKVISSKDVPRNDFRMYDAVLEDKGPSLPPMDPEMEKFLPMLQDYLTLQETTSASSVNPSSSSDSYASTRDDYVWDVFYRRPYSLSEWNSIAANYGMVTGLPPSAEDEEFSDNSEAEEEDEADEDSNAEEYYKNDYPDEECSDSDDDFFNDATDDEDFVSDPADSDHDWR